MDAPDVRPAVPADAEAIAAIYNQGIADRVATFETRPRTAEEARAWVAGRLPCLVATRGDAVIGFARVAPYSEREAYAGVGEHAVYVARRARGGGVGRRLLDALSPAAEAAGLHKLTSRIFSDNAASIAAHEAAGFVVVGVQRRHGRLDGEWKDCVLVERLLGDAARARTEPARPVRTPPSAPGAGGGTTGRT
jgi:L-amino acid N-acyltransferase YncA